jgi:histidinol phosphatase-like PHP family hydrolase
MKTFHEKIKKIISDFCIGSIPFIYYTLAHFFAIDCMLFLLTQVSSAYGNIIMHPFFNSTYRLENITKNLI